MIKKIAQVITIIFLLFIFLIIYIRINENYYESKFNNEKINTSVNEVKKRWGHPDKEFLYLDTNQIHLKYKKGILGWNTYIFIFNKSDSLLVKKGIDD